MKRLTGLTSILLATLIFSSYGFLVRHLSSLLTSSQQIYYKGIIAVPLIFLIILAIYKKLEVKKFFSLKVLVFGLTVPFASFMFYLTLLHSKLSLGLSAFYIGLFITALAIDKIVFKEKLNVYDKISICLALIGFILLSGGITLQTISIGIFYGLLSGFLYSVVNFFKKYLSEFNKLYLLLIISSFNLVVMFLYSKLAGEQSASIPVNLLGLLLLWVFMDLSAEYLTIVGFRNINMYVGSIILSLEIFFGGLIGYFIYKEVLSTTELLGSIIVILALVCSNLKSLVDYLRNYRH